MEKSAREYLDMITGDVFSNYFTPIWNEVCAQIPIRSVLDVGCGNGIFSAALKQTQGCSLHGVDSSPYAVAQSKKLGFDEVLLMNDLSCEPLPYEDRRFDLVFCKDVLEHLLDPEYLVAQMRRVLAPNGHLLVHVPNQFCLYGRLIFLLTNNFDPFHYAPHIEPWNYPHIRFLTYDSFRSLLEKNGFIIKKDYSRYFFCFPKQRFLPFRTHIARMLTRWSPSQFAGGFTLLVQKSGE